MRDHVVGSMALSGGGAPGCVPSALQEAVLLKSEPMPEDSVQVKGHDYSEACCTVETSSYNSGMNYGQNTT